MYRLLKEIALNLTFFDVYIVNFVSFSYLNIYCEKVYDRLNLEIV